jgi:predicted TIM-barrel fold metal-dependent hydrolase
VDVSTPDAERAIERTPAPGLEVIDCDVHPVLKNGLATVYPYMPRPWQERFVRKRASIEAANNVPIRYRHPNGAVVREDARSPDGGIAGSDPHFLIKDLIETHGISAVLLNCLQTGALCTILAGAEESIVLASAFNNFFTEEWLPVDPRLRFAPTVPVQDPSAAAAEIRRIGGHPQIVAVSLPLINVLIGNRYYWPIYAAAEEMDLPIFIHVTGTESVYHGAPIIGAGICDSYIERYLAAPQVAESNLNSLILSGTLEKFSRLKFMFSEYGFLWVLPLLWRMDRAWRGIRREVPWVRKSPIDYVHERCVFTTQPIDEPDDPHHLEQLISLLGEDVLCFSTDYPHWDNDMPDATLPFLSKEARARVFAGNARRVLRLN